MSCARRWMVVLLGCIAVFLMSACATGGSGPRESEPRGGGPADASPADASPAEHQRPSAPGAAESLEPGSLEPESLEPGSLEPESLEPGSLEPESLEPDAFAPDALQAEAPTPAVDEPIPRGLSADELDRLQREIMLQYQQIDHGYEMLEQLYQLVDEHTLEEAPESLVEQHRQLARRHQMLAQMHTDRTRVIVGEPEIAFNDADLAEVNGLLASHHRRYAEGIVAGRLPGEIVQLRQELMIHREDMIDLHFPDGLPAPEDPASYDPFPPTAQ